MKNSSTAALLLALATTVFPALASAQTTPSVVATSARCAFRANAPDQHVVVRGDTLWDISGTFLQHPWCWPKVWDMNREDIRNPHWIYPGQIVYFDRVAGRLRLGKPVGDGSGTPTVRLSPRVRSNELPADAIPSIPMGAIEPFLSKPLVIEETELNDAPRIVATQEGSVYISVGAKAYVRGDLKGATTFDVFHPGKPLKDPSTNQILGYEAVYLGTLRLVRASTSESEPHTFVVTNSKEEMGVGDRMVPQEPTPIVNYVPHPPEQPVVGQIMSVYGGVTQAGQNQIVTINRGAKDGLDRGSVLELYRLGMMMKDTTDPEKPVMKLPDEQYGDLFIFRVFNHVSYGLIMEVRDTAQVGDIVRSPE